VVGLLAVAAAAVVGGEVAELPVGVASGLEVVVSAVEVAVAELTVVLALALALPVGFFHHHP